MQSQKSHIHPSHSWRKVSGDVATRNTSRKRGCRGAVTKVNRYPTAAATVSTTNRTSLEMRSKSAEASLRSLPMGPDRYTLFMPKTDGNTHIDLLEIHIRLRLIENPRQEHCVVFNSPRVGKEFRLAGPSVWNSQADLPLVLGREGHSEQFVLVGFLKSRRMASGGGTAGCVLLYGCTASIAARTGSLRMAIRLAGTSEVRGIVYRIIKGKANLSSLGGGFFRTHARQSHRPGAPKRTSNCGCNRRSTESIPKGSGVSATRRTM